jgi:hypothetical protein
MQIGETNFEITDPLLIEPVFADYYTELRLNNGIVSLSLANSIADASNRPELRIVARLRIPVEALANIQSGLAQIQQQIAKARENAN